MLFSKITVVGQYKPRKINLNNNTIDIFIANTFVFIIT